MVAGERAPNEPAHCKTWWETLAELRACDWTVAVHNDYRLNGEAMTFWLFTHPAGLFVKGEGHTDDEAIRQVAEQARRVFGPSP